MKKLTGLALKYKYFALLGITAVIGLSLGTLFVPSVIGADKEDRVVQEQGWRYTLRIGNGTLEDVRIAFDFKSAAGVQTYTQAMQRENKALFASDTREVTAAPIVFRRFLTWDEADAFVKKYRLSAGDYNARFVRKDDSNDRYVYGIGMTRDAKTGQGFDGQAQKSLEDYMNTTYNGEVMFKGIIGMSAKLDANEYAQVSADPDVYLVDMPGIIVKAKLAAQARPELRGFKIDPNFYIPQASPQLYRSLEDYGLAEK